LAGTVGNDNNEEVTIKELFDYVSENVRRTSRRNLGQEQKLSSAATISSCCQGFELVTIMQAPRAVSGPIHVRCWRVADTRQVFDSLHWASA